jgi:adenylate cyclase
MERRLTAILFYDVVGYSISMGRDEASTIETLKANRSMIIAPTAKQHCGRTIQVLGDGGFMEFASAVDAVRFAIAMQNAVVKRNSELPEERCLVYRIGINIGDVVADDDFIYGDGVNIAARLEGLALPGGICVHQTVRDQVRGKLDLDFDDLGEKSLKNISHPVRAFHVLLDEMCEVEEVNDKQPVQPLAVIKPTVAVLPFENMSGDAEQEFFVDGLTEDILTELSRRHELFVISRNSSFVYKGQAVNIREVAQDLGAQYIVEGSVRKAGERLRITVQLIDAANDSHIWAEKYDRKLDDIFEIQDELTSAIVATLPGRVEAAQHDQLARKTPANMAAYECVLVAKVLHHRSNRESIEDALGLINRALELDPDYAHAHAWRGCIMAQKWVYGWCEDKDVAWDEVIASVGRAFSLDDNDADVHRVLAAIAISMGDLRKSHYHQERALELNPNYDLVVVQQGELLTWLGSPKEGIEWILKAMRLNPHHPERFWSHLGKAYFSAQQYAEAIAAFMHLSVMDHVQHAFLAASYGCTGDKTTAASHVARARVLDPQFSLAAFLDTMHYANDTDLQNLREGLRKAGMVEG